jgi:hypothetical protein
LQRLLSDTTSKFVQYGSWDKLFTEQDPEPVLGINIEIENVLDSEDLAARKEFCYTPSCIAWLPGHHLLDRNHAVSLVLGLSAYMYGTALTVHT